MPYGFVQHHRVLAHARGFDQRFQNRAQVADRYLFAQQLLQGFLNFSQRHELGHQFFHQLGMRLAQPVNQAFRFLASEQFMRILSDDFSQMCCERGSLIDHCVTGRQGLSLLVFCDPLRGCAESGIASVYTGQGQEALAAN